MINQLTRPYNYSVQEITCVATAANNWDSQTNCIKALKIEMNTYLILIKESAVVIVDYCIQNKEDRKLNTLLQKVQCYTLSFLTLQII